MAEVAESAVLVSSAGAADVVAKLTHVRGPSENFDKAEQVLSTYPTMGFQATHFGNACDIAQRMLRRQQPSKVYQIKDGQYVLVPREVDETGKPVPPPLVYPNLFLGIAANLMGTGCRDVVRFLVQDGIEERSPDAAAAVDGTEHQLMFARLKAEYAETYGRPPLADEAPPHFRSFLSCVVLSGGGVEHDLRRACTPYTLHFYASEAPAADNAAPTAARERARFGNIEFPREGAADSALFDCLMREFVTRLCARQARLRAAAAAKPVPEKYLDVCSWAVSPSEVWALCGLWLVDMLTEALKTVRRTSADATAGTAGPQESSPADEGATRLREEALAKARSTVVYWAAHQQVPLFNPSFVDGDIARYLLPTAAQGGAAAAPAAVVERLQVDLVKDVHAINKLAMLSKKTGMLICGGGVVKHHVCNANLMRNGADYTIIFNNGQEYDGSDAGAKPEEALSWGKVRMEGEYVKVYGEVTTLLPLLVAEVFVPAARTRQRVPGEEPRRPRRSGVSTRRKAAKVAAKAAAVAQSDND